LQTVNTCYNGSASPCTGYGNIIANCVAICNNDTPGSANLQSKVVTSYNGYGQLIERTISLRQRRAGPTAIRKKVITIQTVGTYQAIQVAKILDGSNNILAQTTMTFDQGSVTPTSGHRSTRIPVPGKSTTISYLGKAQLH